MNYMFIILEENMENLKNLDTKFIGRNLLFYEKINSTQDLAHELIKEIIPNGTVIFTNNQTNGRGTHNRTWYSSPSQNLTLSIVLYPNIDISVFSNITIEIAQIMVNTIYKLYKINLDIKHPNDLILNNKKIGGILTETKTTGNIAKSLVIGIGLNVNETNIPEYLNTIATSLKLEYKQDFNVLDILVEFLNEFESMYLNLTHLLV